MASQEGIMDFLSVERAREIANTCRNGMLAMKSDAEWSAAIAGVDRPVIDFLTTWALLMQTSNKLPHKGPADETIGEALQYCNIPRYCEVWNELAERNQKLELLSPMKVVDKAVEVLAAGWGYGVFLKRWWEGSPAAKRRLKKN